ncbi:Ig-like domain-containing protein, partial [Rahnella bruchi]
EGKHTFFATATNAAGHVSGHSGNFVITIDVPDTTAPDAPVINTFHDNVGTSTGDFNSGTTTDDTTPTLKGHAEAHSVVKVYEGSTLLGSTTAGNNGDWSFTPSARSEGKHTFFATATDAAGHVSGHSGNFVVNVDIPSPEPGPAKLDYLEDNYQYTQTLRGDEEWPAMNDSTPTIHGTGVAGEVLYIQQEWQAVQFGPVQTTMRGSVTVDSRGEWSFTDSLISTYNGAVYDWVVLGKTSSGELKSLDLGLIISYFHGSDYTACGPIVDIDSGVAATQPSPWFPFLATINHTDPVSLQNVQSDHPDNMQAGLSDTVPVISLAQISDAHKSIAAVDITDHVQNALHLDLNDILSEAHANLFIQDGKQQLAVTGDQGDIVELKVDDLAHNSWQDAGQITSGGIQYEVYQHTGGDVELLVQHGLELHQVA